jgi:hypothetical protein
MVGSRLPATAAVILTGLVIAACGSSSSGNASASGDSSTDPSQAQPQQELLRFAHCMRSHGVSSFPDPSPNGAAFNLNIGGVNSSSPAFIAAQSACEPLLPVKRPPSGPPSPRAYTRLLHWAGCMRAHGIASLPDPKPNPPPLPDSPEANRYGTLMGDGGYWVGIPNSVNAHSPAFMQLSTVCGESPSNRGS